MRKPKVYVSGPMSQGNLKENVKKAIEVGEWLRSQGFLPFIPHLSVVWHDLAPHEHDWWIDLDLEYIEAFGFNLCVRIPGSSPGAEVEEQKFTEMYVRTLSSEDKDAILAWKKAWDEREVVTLEPLTSIPDSDETGYFDWQRWDKRLEELDDLLYLPYPEESQDNVVQPPLFSCGEVCVEGYGCPFPNADATERGCRR